MPAQSPFQHYHGKRKGVLPIVVDSAVFTEYMTDTLSQAYPRRRVGWPGGAIGMRVGGGGVRDPEIGNQNLRTGKLSREP